jgi:hypothetical protein
MKRSSEDVAISPGSSQNVFQLLSHAKIMRIVTTIENEELFSEIVANVFTESFIVVEKQIFNKSTINTLVLVGSVSEVAICIIRYLVIFTFKLNLKTDNLFV